MNLPTMVRTVGNELYVEDLPLTQIASMFGTPSYVYSKAALTQAYVDFTSAFAGRDIQICYAVKANSNLAILGLFAALGAGFDIVSEGELARVLAAGGDPRKIVFSGVGKRVEEMRAALRHNILCFNVESEPELMRLAEAAEALGVSAPISLRVNPDVDPRTHPYIATGQKEDRKSVV